MWHLQHKLGTLSVIIPHDSQVYWLLTPVLKKGFGSLNCSYSNDVSIKGSVPATLPDPSAVKEKIMVQYFLFLVQDYHEELKY